MNNNNKYGVYNQKIYELNDLVEIQLQTKHQSFLIEGSETRGRKKNKVFSSEEEEELYNLHKQQARENYYREKARDVRRTVQLNKNEKTKFLTLTFNNENHFGIDNIKEANFYFTKFVQRLSYFLNKNNENSKNRTIQYIATHELTKKGRVHYHVVLFNLPFIHAKKIEEIWGAGFIKINSLDDVEDKFVSFYISKYLTKDLETKVNYSKAILSSKNLKRPEPSRINYDFGFRENEFEDFKKIFLWAREQENSFEWTSFDWRAFKSKNEKPKEIQKITVTIEKDKYEKFIKENNLKPYQFWTTPSYIEKKYKNKNKT